MKKLALPLIAIFILLYSLPSTGLILALGCCLFAVVYLEDVLRRIMDHPAKHVHELLPDNWLKARQQIITE